MATILPFIDRGSVFDPEMTRLMAGAFEDACQLLNLDNDRAASERVAARIIALVQRGERDPARLRDAAVGISVRDSDVRRQPFHGMAAD